MRWHQPTHKLVLTGHGGDQNTLDRNVVVDRRNRRRQAEDQGSEAQDTSKLLHRA
jgi:hypothetical protein